MTYYVYIIQSSVDGGYYKGYSEEPLNRLHQHNRGESNYTSAKTPWHLVYVEIMSSKTEALKRERAVKKYGHERILRLIASPKNSIEKYLGTKN